MIMQKEIEQLNQEDRIIAEMPYGKVVNYENLLKIIHGKQENGIRVVLTTGVYDIAHFKHAESLASIKMFGDFLVVGVPSDEEIIAASHAEKQIKDKQGPVIEYEKRVKLIAHLPYVDLIFAKTKDKKALIDDIMPDVLVQSITSGVAVVREVLDLSKSFEHSIMKGCIYLSVGDRKCKLVFMDDIKDGETQIIPFDKAVESAEQWQRDKFLANRFNGSLIKQRIIQRHLGERT